MIRGERLPEWLRPKLSLSRVRPAKKLLREEGVLTVCEEARCPNKAECFSRPSAAFMILGSVCTRNCGFCAVTSGKPLPPDPGEPSRIAGAVKRMDLRYVVVTSVTRDDLCDGGAEQFAKTVNALRAAAGDTRVEVLAPDFKGSTESIRTVLESGPDVYNHNIETVPSLYGHVRPGAIYERSLETLESAKSLSPGIRSKSGIMLGLGESLGEVKRVLSDLRSVGCDFVTIGQYLRPGKVNLPVKEYVRPEVFEGLRLRALEMGFSYVASSPLTRSSMNAEEMFSS